MRLVRMSERGMRYLGFLILLLSVGLFFCQSELASQEGLPTAQQRQSEQKPGLVIENDPELPDTYQQTPYEYRFHAHGGIGAMHWRLEKGSLPPGLKLEDDGLLHGAAARMGGFQFTVAVRSIGVSGVQKGFVLRVRSALSLRWKNQAHVNGNRIEGSADVSNTTPDDIDLTFIVLAVPADGRATAIGYQHFLLRRGTTEKELPFGETLPRGGYVVHVDTIGEVAAKNLIYRDRLQTPEALQVMVGP